MTKKLFIKYDFEDYAIMLAWYKCIVCGEKIVYISFSRGGINTFSSNRSCRGKEEMLSYHCVHDIRRVKET